MSAWPPVWSNPTRGGGAYATKRGEIGTLTNVSGNRVVPDMCFLYIEHDGESYCGALILDNAAFCSHLIPFLQQQIGKSISEIGDLDVSELL
jgi:hypothetical protein